MYIESKKRAWTREESMKLFNYVQSNVRDTPRTNLFTWNRLVIELGFINRSAIEIKKHYYGLLKLKEFFDKNVSDQLSLKVELEKPLETKEYKKFQKMVDDFKNDREEASDSITTICANGIFK